MHDVALSMTEHTVPVLEVLLRDVRLFSMVSSAACLSLFSHEALHCSKLEHCWALDAGDAMESTL